MATLRQILDQTLDLLQHPEFKSFGALQKSRYQHSKGEEDREIRRLMYKGGLGNSEEAKQKAAKTREKNQKAGKYKEVIKKAAKTRSDWYKNPENYKKFKESLNKRDKKKNIQKSSSIKA